MVPAWQAFSILGVDTDWVKQDLREWGVDRSYLEYEEFARLIKYVNDSDEGP